MKKKVKVLQYPARISRDVSFMNAQEVKDILGDYELNAIFYMEGDDEELCEMAFDLSNNPAREAQRSWFFGNQRSVSVGDVVQINDRFYLCDRIGWTLM